MKEKKPRQVQIPLTLFYDIYDWFWDYIFYYDYYDYAEEKVNLNILDAGNTLLELEKKHNALKVQEAYSKYKKEADGEKRNNFYEEYQDKVAECHWEELKLQQKVKELELKWYSARKMVQEEKNIIQAEAAEAEEKAEAEAEKLRLCLCRKRRQRPAGAAKRIVPRTIKKNKLPF